MSAGNVAVQSTRSSWHISRGTTPSRGWSLETRTATTAAGWCDRRAADGSGAGNCRGRVPRSRSTPLLLPLPASDVVAVVAATETWLVSLSVCCGCDERNAVVHQRTSACRHPLWLVSASYHLAGIRTGRLSTLKLLSELDVQSETILNCSQWHVQQKTAPVGAIHNCVLIGLLRCVTSWSGPAGKTMAARCTISCFNEWKKTEQWLYNELIIRNPTAP